uniref:Transferase transferring glycosyl groups n=1 Tax=Rhizophora mucronata TaxID=61149 RepID=A0A2P2QLW4_RHIMU
MFIPLLAHLWHSSSTICLMTGSVESSRTWITRRSAGQERLEAAPIESL